MGSIITGVLSVPVDSLLLTTTSWLLGTTLVGTVDGVDGGGDITGMPGAFLIAFKQD